MVGTLTFDTGRMWNTLAVYTELVERSPEIISHKEICELAWVRIDSEAQLKTDARDIMVRVRNKHDAEKCIKNEKGVGWYYDY